MAIPSIPARIGIPGSVPVENQNDGQEKEQHSNHCQNRHQRNGFRFGNLHSGLAAGSLEGAVNLVVTASLIQQIRVLYDISDFVLGRLSPQRGLSPFNFQSECFISSFPAYLLGLLRVKILKGIIDNFLGSQRK
jgi:hypothetical protein